MFINIVRNYSNVVSRGISRRTQLSNSKSLDFGSFRSFSSRSQLPVPPSTSTDEERIHKFLDPNVQTILKKLTGKDYSRIFRIRKVGQKLREPKVTFMTEEQLKETVQEADRNADKYLQMPPVLLAKTHTEQVIQFDPKLQGYSDSAYVMTDVSLSAHNKDRLIVVRDLDGTLRHADLEDRKRMINIYYPMEGREFYTPKMFSDKTVLTSVLQRASPEDNTYEFALDRACLQFEPDDAEYIHAVEFIYNHIDQMRHYHFLQSTRHYGPMVFYLTRSRKIDNLLLHYIENERVSPDASMLISLFHLIFPECASKKKLSEFQAPSDDMNMDITKIRSYIQFDSVKKGDLDLTLNSYVELVEKREELEKGLERAHGIN